MSSSEVVVSSSAGLPPHLAEALESARSAERASRPADARVAYERVMYGLNPPQSGLLASDIARWIARTSWSSPVVGSSRSKTLYPHRTARIGVMGLCRSGASSRGSGAGAAHPVRGIAGADEWKPLGRGRGEEGFSGVRHGARGCRVSRGSDAAGHRSSFHGRSRVVAGRGRCSHTPRPGRCPGRHCGQDRAPRGYGSAA